MNIKVDPLLMRLKGHVLIIQHHSLVELLGHAVASGFDQFTLFNHGTTWELSAPLDEANRKEFAWLYHRMKVIDQT